MNLKTLAHSVETILLIYQTKRVVTNYSTQAETAEVPENHRCVAVEEKEPQKTLPNSRKRRHKQTSWSVEDIVSHAQRAIKLMKGHTERGTCPEDLRYRARARIKADTEF